MADNLTFNKIAGAALATGLAIFGLQNLTSIAFESNPPAKAGYAIAIQEDTSGGGEPVDLPPDWGTVLPHADVAAGQAVTAKCASCHQFDPADTPSIGPGLYGVEGRKPATQANYTTYDDAMKGFSAKNPVWTYDLLYQFLKSPQGFIPGVKMTFIGLKSPQDRINVIAYLHTLGSTLPIPAPNPKAASAGASTNSAAATGSGNAAAPASSATPAPVNGVAPSDKATQPKPGA